jgi:hypothetical protein
MRRQEVLLSRGTANLQLRTAVMLQASLFGANLRLGVARPSIEVLDINGAVIVEIEVVAVGGEGLYRR